MTQSEFLKHLKAYRSVLSRHTLLTLRGQAVSGDVDGAMRGLARMLKNKSGCVPPTAGLFIGSERICHYPKRTEGST